MAYARRSHVVPTVERARFDELLSQARAGDLEARRELWETHHIRIYVQGDALVDTMNHPPPSAPSPASRQS